MTASVKALAADAAPDDRSVTGKVKAGKSVAQAYADGELPELFRLNPGDLPALSERVSFRPELDRAALAAALREYHQGLGTLNPALEAQLVRLEQSNSAVVVTGQQAGVLGGPAYSVHKGASALLLARDLDRPGAPVLPVYWVASQDHDAAEVASTSLLDYSETLHRLHLDLPEGVPVGRMPWKPEYTAAVRSLTESFDTDPGRRASVLELLEWTMRAGPSGMPSVADVFARLLHRLLGAAPGLEDGLILLDPLHPALAALMAPALKRELARPLESSRLIEAAATRLEAQGFTPQLRRPAGATNLFLEVEDGGRELLRFAGTTFEAGRVTYTQAQLETLLAAHPDRLTPAAGLRPAIQDALLPTLAFVVGPGEIAYGAQLREVYALHGLEQPLLWPRLSVTWLESNVARILGRFSLTPGELQADPEGALGSALAVARGAAAASSDRLSELQARFTQLSAELAALDPTLEGAATRTGTRSLAQLSRLQELSVRALARAENDRTGQLSRLKLHLLPNGVPQEREMNFMTYVLKHGDEPLRKLLSQRAGGSVSLKLE